MSARDTRRPIRIATKIRARPHAVTLPLGRTQVGPEVAALGRGPGEGHAQRFRAAFHGLRVVEQGLPPGAAARLDPADVRGRHPGLVGQALFDHPRDNRVNCTITLFAASSYGSGAVTDRLPTVSVLSFDTSPPPPRIRAETPFDLRFPSSRPLTDVGRVWL